MLAVELHTHSIHSYDGHDSVEQLLDAARASSLDAIAVTDHDDFSAGRRAAELSSEELLVIPGMEVSSAAGHVLGLGIDRAIERGLPFRKTVERIHDAEGIAVVPHPFQELRKGVLGAIPKTEIKAADAIEVYNSRLFTGRANRQADSLADEYGMTKTAGSDAHIAEMVGRAQTLVETDDRSVDGILTAIRNGNTTVQGRRTPYRITLRQVAGSATRRARHQFF
ncbi:PHP domain-containing protein [Halovenus sp. HT40]|uniref:PHP domain-containing protein n=1 Tax=Halovenus sp. HT40 TaxID=3126691 RepID=UPI00300EE946